ncbi:pseudouridine synthase [uncultured Cytophaga sp.]|uniref:pseudouridine synthase n=1 Tax=uncultured Cytophaga sp. TaxID=160238 RepID=UPI0026357464|nr:pseudouridine synthase [uncultured Cytophaga sp.]
MTKQRANNNKRPASSRPTSSKGRSNSTSEGRSSKSANSKSSTRSSGPYSKKSSSEGSSKGNKKEEKDLYGAKRSSRSTPKKFESSKRTVGRGPSGRKPAKTNYPDKEEKFIPYNLRSDDTKSPYTPRGNRSNEEPRSRGESKPASSRDRTSPGRERKSPSRDRTFPDKEGSSDRRRPSSDRERPASDRKRVSSDRERPSPDRKRPSLDRERPTSDRSRSSSDRERPTTAKRSFTKSDDDFKSSKRSDSDESKPRGVKKSTGSRGDAFKENRSDARPTRFESTDSRSARPKPKKDEDFEDDFSDSESKGKSKFDGDSVKRGRKSYANKLDILSKNKPNAAKISVSDPSEIRLNKYIANSGVCSRREADQLILEGTVKINGVVVTELGYKVKVGDSVKYNNKVLNPEKLVYVLLNKPKDFITTMDDENERKTVMQLIANATTERIYPVGRLDRNTTGLLLFTNDGELAQKLTHPSNKIKKIYEVELDKPLTAEDFDKIAEGKIHLFDGPVKVDEIAIISPNKKMIGIEIHEGRNRIVRRIFESLGYDVQKLDRVMYAGLTKKNVTRGSWRYLTATEVNKMKYLD